MIPRKNICSLIVNAIFVKVLLGFPRTVVENSGNAAWIQVIYNLAVVMIIFYTITAISNKKKNIIEVMQVRWLRITAGILVSLILFINLLIVIRSFPDEVKAAMLQEENKSVLTLLLVAASAAGAFSGIEAIARASRLFLPLMMIIFFVSIALLIPKYNIENLFPIFGLGANKIFISGFNTLSLFSDLIMLNLLIPYAKKYDDILRGGRNAILISGIGAVLAVFVYCLTYSYPLSSEFAIPLYNMARLINITSFFNRFEAFYEFVWTIIVLIYTSSYMYILAYSIKTTFRLKSIRKVLAGTVIITAAASLIQNIDPALDSMWKYSYTLVFGAILLFGRKRRKTA